MPELKEGIPLHQPTAKVHRANRRPIWMASFILVLVVVFFIWAYIKAGQRQQVVRSEQESTAKGDPVPATSARQELSLGLSQKHPGTASKEVATDKSAANNTKADSIPDLSVTTKQDSQDTQNQQTRGTQEQEVTLTPEQQAAKQAADDEAAAMEAPLASQSSHTTLPQPATPNMPTDPTAALLAAAQNHVSPDTANTVAKLLHGENHDAGQSYTEQNGQNDKRAYYTPGRRPEPILAPAAVTDTEQGCIIHAGWDIPAALEQASNSDLPGELRARVRNNVYDSKTGTRICIPQNSILLGDYNSSVGYAQNRLQVRWHTLEFPDNRPDIDLDSMAGLDADGAAGLSGTVNNYYKRLIGFTLLSSAFAAGIELSQNRNASTLAYPSSGQVVGQAVGQQMGEFGQQMARTNLQRQPTIVAPAGTRFNVRVNRTIAIME